MENQQRFIEIDGQQVLVTEEVYRAYKRPLWTEQKRKEREKRCRDKNGNRCTGDCNKCDNQRTGSVLSLNGLIEESGFELTDAVDIAELAADKLLFEELYAALDELDPDNRRIMLLFSIGKSEREIAAEVGLSQKAVNKRKVKLFAHLWERLKDYV
jgi:DNA-directed RNA polymerase specialized sigma24 family protein